MHRAPLDVVARRDLTLEGHPVHAGTVYHCDGFDRKTGDITVAVAPQGRQLCTERVKIPLERRPEFRIRWEWTTSTEAGGKVVQLAAFAILAPIWIGADLLLASGIPSLTKIGEHIHPKRSNPR